MKKVQNLTEWVDRFLKQDSPLAGPLDTFIADASKYLEEWLRKSVLQQSDFIASITTGVYNVVKSIFNVIIGFIVSVYVLMTKEKFIGQLKKIIMRFPSTLRQRSDGSCPESRRGVWWVFYRKDH